MHQPLLLPVPLLVLVLLQAALLLQVGDATQFLLAAQLLLALEIGLAALVPGDGLAALGVGHAALVALPVAAVVIALPRVLAFALAAFGIAARVFSPLLRLPALVGVATSLLAAVLLCLSTFRVTTQLLHPSGCLPAVGVATGLLGPLPRLLPLDVVAGLLQGLALCLATTELARCVIAALGAALHLYALRGPTWVDHALLAAVRGACVVAPASFIATTRPLIAGSAAIATVGIASLIRGAAPGGLAIAAVAFLAAVFAALLGLHRRGGQAAEQRQTEDGGEKGSVRGLHGSGLGLVAVPRVERRGT
ncbi:MAG: hypothetical protein Q4F49_05920 [Pseudoxanthomonas suwonensis]|nr:hypothetical protein [Pseudoxanthomonas suwonensis]